MADDGGQPTFEELSVLLVSMADMQRRAAQSLLGTAIGDAAGLPFELSRHAQNREMIDPYQTNGQNADCYCAVVLSMLEDRLKDSQGTPFGRTYSDDTVCTDLKMQAISRFIAMPPVRPSQAGVDMFKILMQEYLTWAHNADGNLFQGYGCFTKDLLRPTRDNRLGDLGIEPCDPTRNDFHPTDAFLQFAQEYFQGSLPGGFPSWGNGAVMSFAPQVIYEIVHGGNAEVANVLSSSHVESSALIGAALLRDLLRSIFVGESSASACAGLRQAVLASHSWRAQVQPMAPNPANYMYPILAFSQFLESGDCTVDAANEFLKNLLTFSGRTWNDGDAIQDSGPFGFFGSLLRIAANYDDSHGLSSWSRLSVGGSQRELVRFSQRGLNTVLIAIWCADGARTCWDWLQRVLYVGGDADTIGAVAGQIACPLLGAADVIDFFQRFVALEGTTTEFPVNRAAAVRFMRRTLDFASGQTSNLLNMARLVDPFYAGLTDPSGRRLFGQMRQNCRHGRACYQTKHGHRDQYAHPWDDDWRPPPCRFGHGCRDPSKEHQTDFVHPMNSESRGSWQNYVNDWDAGRRGKGGRQGT
eukprot:TRINITY_DN15789_c1_g1_i1.p1 TRINITY_DN15789_c1_g1~~TRINITY_DN15789_c1_g1_i1.p1  ORF type:complete len:612 (-),score=60.83 TRINITY_DN15789_c1_g1_i1:112-1863(-)